MWTYIGAERHLATQLAARRSEKHLLKLLAQPRCDDIAQHLGADAPQTRRRRRVVSFVSASRPASRQATGWAVEERRQRIWAGAVHGQRLFGWEVRQSEDPFGAGTA